MSDGSLVVGNGGSSMTIATTSSPQIVSSSDFGVQVSGVCLCVCVCSYVCVLVFVFSGWVVG